jgi:hypothetical protein
MTASRYKRPSARRDIDTLLGRTNSVEFGNPRPTFRAAISDSDLVGGTLDETMRIGYYTGVGPDTVYWNYWDDNYDRTFFSPFTTTVLGIPCVLAVELLIPGIYAIRATIDWILTDYDFPTVPFHTWIGSNYDDGGVTDIYMDPNSDIIMTWVMDQFRVMWPNFTGAESLVEITAYHDDATDEPLFIPGGNGGYWGMPPMLTIVYLGGIEGDPDFFSDA